MLIKTSFMDMVLNHSVGTNLISLPGTHVVVGFINRYLNMEDGCCVSKERAESGILTWSRVHQLPPAAGRGARQGRHVNQGQVLVEARHRRHSARRKHEQDRGRACCTHVGAKKLEIGDRLGVAHGLNFTVADIIPLADMPRIVNEQTEEVIVPNLLLSTKNLTRGSAACSGRWPPSPTCSPPSIRSGPGPGSSARRRSHSRTRSRSSPSCRTARFW